MVGVFHFIKPSNELVSNIFLLILATNPLSLGYVGADVLSLLTDDALIAQWNNEGLPSDNMSTENATILTNSVKWPLIIDPQLQGIKWIKNRFQPDLVVIRLGEKNYLDTIEE